MNCISHILRTLCLAIALTVSCVPLGAQTEVEMELVDTLNMDEALSDTLLMELDMDRAMADTFQMDIEKPISALVDTLHKSKRDWSTWRPDPKRALWLAAVLPGAGQIYNRKYWKLPIFYGGFIGCFYAIRWNNMMYNDYAQAYLDLMDDNPETHSYDKFQHLGAEITAANMPTWQNKFKRRKDYYRRYRDLSAFIMIGVYALSIIDAYVDASLSEFDISNDLSLRVAPAVIQGGASSAWPSKQSALGVQCLINF